MERFWGHALSAAVLTVAAGSVVPACAHDDASLFVNGVLAPPQLSGTTCTYTASPTSAMINGGVVDGALAHSYAPEFLVGNTLIPQGNPSTPDSETSRIEVQGAIVRVVDPGTNATIENATVLASAEVDPASGSQPSYAAVTASIMDDAAINYFLAKAPMGETGETEIALVYVTFFGQTLGGQNIQSNQYQFPVDVCYGCRITVPPGAASGYCQGKLPSASSNAACVPGQDQYEDCQLCYSVSTACNLTP